MSMHQDPRENSFDQEVRRLFRLVAPKASEQDILLEETLADVRHGKMPLIDAVVKMVQVEKHMSGTKVEDPKIPKK